MRDSAYRVFPAPRKSPSVITVTGQGVSVRVRRHELEVRDGFPLESPPQTRRVTRATSRIDRLLFLAGSGIITVDAADWCAENGAPVVAVDQSGNPRWTLLPTTSGAGEASLRRAQALAPFTEAGVEIVRWLVQRKVEGQRDVLHDLAKRTAALPAGEWSRMAVPGAALALEKVLPRVGQARTIPALRAVEADAAAVYWSGLAGLPLHFAPPSYARTVPSHWRSFVGRGSPLTNGPRNAVDPPGALLNYAYSLLEAEARVACAGAGLDLSLGLLHTDTASRRSLVYDVMEPVRPIADRLVLTLLLSHAFRPGELHQLRDGRCRLDQDLCARLWRWMPTFRQALGPVMAFLLGRLRKGPRYGDYRAYRLVEIAPPARTRRPLGQKRWAPDAPAPDIRAVAVCRSCSVLLDDVRPDRLYCDDCAPAHLATLGETASVRGRAILAKMRDEGRDPAHGGEAGRKRSEAIRRSHREHAMITAELMLDDAAVRAHFRKLLPRLRQVSLSRIAGALGVTPGYASFIRRGLRTPHPRHLEALRALAK